MHDTSLESLFEAAIASFPHSDLEPTSYEQGDFDPDDEGEVEYSKEFTFSAGQLFNEQLMAGGWIDLRRDRDGEISISGLFAVARNGDWKEGSIFPECVGVQALYDLEQQTWELWIDSY